MSDFGYFVGRVNCEWLREEGPDRLMRLTRRFVYVGPDRRRWVAPVGLIFDGASIPRAMWPIIGNPLQDDYRDAAVIHDAAYQAQASSREDADKAFYTAMRASGVSFIKAQTIYRAVRLFGWAAWANKQREVANG